MSQKKTEYHAMDFVKVILMRNPFHNGLTNGCSFLFNKSFMKMTSHTRETIHKKTIYYKCAMCISKVISHSSCIKFAREERTFPYT